MVPQQSQEVEQLYFSVYDRNLGRIDVVRILFFFCCCNVLFLVSGIKRASLGVNNDWF